MYQKYINFYHSISEKNVTQKTLDFIEFYKKNAKEKDANIYLETLDKLANQSAKNHIALQYKGKFVEQERDKVLEDGKEFLQGYVLDKMKIKVKVLIVAASPLDMDRTSAKTEIQKIKTELKRKCGDLVEIDFILQATKSNLLETVKYFQPNIIHFTGHGEDRGLVLVDENELSATLVNTDFIQVIEETGDTLFLIYLNACSTKTISDEIFKYKKNAHIISFKNTIDVDVSIDLAIDFYSRLTNEILISQTYKSLYEGAKGANKKYRKLIEGNYHFQEAERSFSTQSTFFESNLSIFFKKITSLFYSIGKFFTRDRSKKRKENSAEIQNNPITSS